MQRILLGPMPRIAEEILREAARWRIDVRIVEVVQEWAALPAGIALARPDAVILADAGCHDGLPELLVNANPGMTVLLLRGDGRESRTYRVERFGTLSPDEILDVAARSRGAAAEKGDAV